eukprot:5206779-Alexandrium_andersonii.AAC.1
MHMCTQNVFNCSSLVFGKRHVRKPTRQQNHCASQRVARLRRPPKYFNAASNVTLRTSANWVKSIPEKTRILVLATKKRRREMRAYYAATHHAAAGRQCSSILARR